LVAGEAVNHQPQCIRLSEDLIYQMSRLEPIPEIDMSNQCNLPFLYNNSLANLQSKF
jgi:hypothetical protein